MKRLAFALSLVLPAASFAQVSAHAEHRAPPALSRAELASFAKLNVALARARDSAQHQLGLPEHLNDKSQDSLRARLKTVIADILQQNSVTEEEYRHKTLLLSTNDDIRWTYDTLVAQLTGAPLPTKYVGPADVKLPAGAVGVHMGHVLVSFGDTPEKQGLLPTAMAEARVAIQHAGLAARAPTSLDGMKLHAGHVINALDPTLVATGPGLGYGMKKAALGVANHIELAAKVDSASANVKTHSVHVATAARGAVAHADSAIAIAQRIQAATTAEEAATLVTQLVAETQALVAGAPSAKPAMDGLQKAQDHMNLMVAGEGRSP